ncbi:MAG: hypothetical protein GY777_09400 [Candidatus Brocadiaceae bacterium]|nr:hypothetical protein [Candidatus Brocadiaceae bacterium]
MRIFYIQDGRQRDKRLSFDSTQDEYHTERSRSAINIEIPMHRLIKSSKVNIVKSGKQ